MEVLHKVEEDFEGWLCAPNNYDSIDRSSDRQVFFAMAHLAMPARNPVKACVNGLSRAKIARKIATGGARPPPFFNLTVNLAL
ncbi:hypothetical protein KMS_R19780 [Pseudomonas sp. LRP2-20]|uniref:hypothetical protein n=1 Tax=Pseudomonas sp. LRP2-20 TaxID=2944234 RepID=UPI0021845FC9|nr:hypothetical protein [Pseudomonas sp. LRP2-20]BDM22220.1 hypothetical protein KMS_R19780 [Pseudomonas sp. LRP2-20]